ncbi:MAG: helix-turn-helix domain-containing protein [Planctomycetota bacterium]
MHFEWDDAKAEANLANLMKMHLDPNDPNAGKTDWDRVDALTDEEIQSQAAADVDARPLTKEELASMERLPDVKRIRQSLGMTQEVFAATFHLSLSTVRDWEQGRFAPDQSARTLLRLIATIPNQVREALAGPS